MICITHSNIPIAACNAPSPTTMKIYYHDNTDADQREPHDSGKPVPQQTLDKLGVLAYPSISPDKVDQVAAERGYVNRDEICITPQGLGGQDTYQAKLKIFYAEHLHEDEEIRYIVDGDGYFDVRSAHDDWIRIAMEKDDMIILPPGIYHRFTLSSNDYIKAMRLFQNEPKWVPYNRPDADHNPHRVKYVESIS